MANETKTELRFLAAGAEKIVPQPANGQAENKPARSGWLARNIAPLAAGLAILASAPANNGCDSASNPIVNEDADSDTEEQGETEVGADADTHDSEAEQDSEADVAEVEPDADVAEDEASDAHEVEPDSDVVADEGSDVPDLEEAGDEAADAEASDVPDVEPDSDASEVEGEAPDGEADGSDVPVCTPGTPYTEDETRVAPDNMCDNPFETGSAQEVHITWEVTPLSGEGCDPETRVPLVYEVRFNPPLDATILWCARGDILSMPWGDETVVSMATDSLETAPTRGDARLGLYEMHAWGAGEYRSRIANFSPVVVETISPDGTASLGTVDVFGSGYAPIPDTIGVGPRAYLASDVDTIGETAEISYVETPVIDRAEGGTVPYAGGTYTVHFNVSGTEHGGIVLTRE